MSTALAISTDSLTMEQPLTQPAPPAHLRGLYDIAVLRNLDEALRASGLPQDFNVEILGLVGEAMERAKHPPYVRLME